MPLSQPLGVWSCVPLSATCREGEARLEALRCVRQQRLLRRGGSDAAVVDACCVRMTLIPDNTAFVRLDVGLRRDLALQRLHWRIAADLEPDHVPPQRELPHSVLLVGGMWLRLALHVHRELQLVLQAQRTR